MSFFHARASQTTSLHLLLWVFCVVAPGVAHAQAPTPPLTHPPTLRVVTDENYPPFLFKDSQGKATGYTVDLWALWSQKTGVQAQVVPMQWSEAQKQVLDGRADVIDMIYRTPDRETTYDFSAPYAKLPVAIYSHTTITGVHTLDTLRGFQVGVQRGDACAEHLQRQGITTLKAYPNYNALLNAASLDEIRLFCMDVLPAQHYLYQRNMHQDYVKALDLYSGEFHQAVVKNNAQTLALVQQGMNAISDTERQALHDKWLQAPTSRDAWGRPALVGSGVLLLVGSLLMFWRLSMRRMVQRHTATLEAERSRVKNILDTLPDLVWVKDPAGRYLACNKRFEQLYGATEEQIRGKTDFDFVEAPLAQFFRANDLAAMQADAPRANREDLTFASDGHMERMETIKSPLRDSNGSLLGVLGIARNLTDMLASQEALQVSLTRLEEAERIARFGHWDLLLTTGQMHWSAEVYRICGLHQTQTQPDSAVMLALVHPLDRDRVQAALNPQQVLPNAQQVVLRLVTPQGTLKHLQLHFEVLANSAGEPWRLVGLVQDVTHQVRAEQDLKSRNDIFAAIANQSSDAIALVDPDTGRFLEFNRAAHQNLGYTAQEFNSMRVADIDHLHPAAEINAMLHRLQSGGEHVIESQHRHRDGSVRDVRIKSQAIHLHDRTHLAAIWTDITESKAQAAAIEDYRRQLQHVADERGAALHNLGQEQFAIFESAPVGIALIQDRVVVKSNRRLETLFGAPPGGMTGQPTRLWYSSPEINQSVLDGPYAQVMAGERATFEARLVKQSGELFWARINAQLLDKQAPENGLLCILEDIESEHQATEALRRGQDMARAAAQIKSDFLANMGHEIRTPMNAILGNAHLMERSALNAGQKTHLQHIFSAGRQLLGLINTLLDFSKMVSGPLVLDHKPFSSQDLWAHIQQNATVLASAKGLDWEMDVGPAVPDRVVGDAPRLEQALMNLCHNAVKFTAAGTVGLRVRVLQAHAHKTLLRLEVHDTGVGMEPEQIAKVFLPFVQGNTSANRAYGGLGLGLAITQHIVHAMQGEVGIDSQLGAGTTVWCTVWVETPPQPPQSAVPPPSADNWLAVRQTLHALLTAGDASAPGYAQQHQGVLKHALGEQAPAFLNAVDHFHFETALEWLTNIPEPTT